MLLSLRAYVKEAWRGVALFARTSRFPPVEIRLNGEPRKFPEGISLVDLVEQLGLSGRRVAVECNRNIIPRHRHAEHLLVAGDVVEVVQFVGGG